MSSVKSKQGFRREKKNTILMAAAFTSIGQNGYLHSGPSQTTDQRFQNSGEYLRQHLHSLTHHFNLKLIIDSHTLAIDFTK